jgi:hypothetical protein
MTNIQKYPEKDKSNMTIEAMKQALEFIDSVKVHSSLIAARDSLHDTLRTAIAEAESVEPVAWLTKELMADYLDMIAEAIEDKKSEMLRHKAYWMRKGDV